MQRRSNTIAELATALAVAQGQMAPASKDSLNPHFGQTYAGLSSVWAACRKPLSDNGLAIVQTTSSDGPKAITTTTLLHKSGEWIEDDLVITVAQPTAQALGSAFSYGRRYSLAGMAGIASASDDDDGESAVGREPPKEIPQKIKRPLARPPKEFPWANRDEMVAAYEALKPFVDPQTWDAAIHAHEIQTGEDGQLRGTKRQFLQAYQTLEELAALGKAKLAGKGEPLNA